MPSGLAGSVTLDATDSKRPYLNTLTTSLATSINSRK